MAATAPVREIGYAQAVNYNWWLYEEETTPELIWPQSISVYDSMRRTDAQVASVLRAVNLPVRRTQWRIDPAGARPRVVKFVADDLGLPIVGKGKQKPPPRAKDKFSWQEHLRLALLELVYGHMYFEQVYTVNDAGTEAHLRKLAPRMPKTIERIDVASDGGLISIQQWWTKINTRPQPIPVDRLVAYVHDREGGNWLGSSILRPAYKNWLIKDRLLRVQAQTIERNGMGIPLYTAAETETDLTAGLGMATSWRAGEAAGSAVPYGASLKLVGVEGTLPDADPAIRYHDEQIARAVLAHFLNLGTQTGSWALGATFADFFVFSLQTLAQQIADVTTQHVIEDIVDVNFGENEPAPKLVFDEIGSQQAATAQALKMLVDAGVIHPDQILEETSRQQYGLPPADPATATPPPGAPAAAEPDPTPTGALSVAAGFDPTEPRDPHSGKWADGPGGAISDALKLAGRIQLGHGESLAGSSRAPDNGGDFDAVFAKVVGPSGAKVRFGTVLPEDARRWRAADKGRTVELDADGVKQLEKVVADAPGLGKASVADYYRGVRTAHKAGVDPGDFPDPDADVARGVIAAGWGDVHWSVTREADTGPELPEIDAAGAGWSLALDIVPAGADPNHLRDSYSISTPAQAKRLGKALGDVAPG
jgi:hypothetical protein